jgi:hypothetical protein
MPKFIKYLSSENNSSCSPGEKNRTDDKKTVGIETTENLKASVAQKVVTTADLTQNNNKNSKFSENSKKSKKSFNSFMSSHSSHNESDESDLISMLPKNLEHKQSENNENSIDMFQAKREHLRGQRYIGSELVLQGGSLMKGGEQEN